MSRSLIDTAKQYRTRDYRRVRIYATDGGGSFPVHGAIYFMEKTRWVPTYWTKDGLFRNGETGRSDLILLEDEV